MPLFLFEVLRRTGRAILAVAVLSIINPARVFAVEDLPGIVIEAANLEGAPVAAAETGSAVSVVTGEQLRQRQIRNVGEALRSLPGVHVNRTGAFGGLTQIRVRGAESNHVLVLIDGVEANATTDGEFDFSDITTDHIERIEVLRGPQSGLYGSSALAGVINIITRKGAGGLAIGGKFEGGSFETAAANVFISGGNEKAHAAFTLSRNRTSGFNISPEGNEDDGSEFSAIGFKGGVEIFKGLTVNGVFRYSNKDGERDDQPTGVGAIGTLQPSVDRLSTFGSKIWLGGLNAKLILLDGLWEQQAKISGNTTIRSDTAVDPVFGTSFSRNDSLQRKYSYLSTLHLDGKQRGLGSHHVTGLVERKIEEFTPVTDDGVTRRRERDALAAEYRGAFFNTLIVNATVRHDDNDTLEDFTTYRVAASLQLPAVNARLHGSAGTGVRFPDMFQQFGQIPSFGFVPNPDLEPEESFGWDAGIEATFGGGAAIIDLTYFDQNLENAIIVQFAPVFTSLNLPGESTRRGVEVAGRIRLSENLDLSGAYTYLLAARADGTTEVRRPKHAGRLDLNYRFARGRGNFNLGLGYNGAMNDVALRNAVAGGFASFEAVTVVLDHYLLATVAASYEVRPGVSLYGRVENLLDEDYQEVFGFETAGLAAYGGLRFRYGSDGNEDGLK